MASYILDALATLVMLAGSVGMSALITGHMLRRERMRRNEERSEASGPRAAAGG